MVAPPRGFAHERIPLAVVELCKVDTRFFEHVGQFAGVNGGVDVLKAAGPVLGAHAFVLLGRARHDGDRIDLGPVVFRCVRAVGLGQGAHHADRGFARRHMGEQFRVERLHVLVPAGATGGELGQRLVDFFGQALDELRPLFPDGHVGGVLVVPDVAEAEFLQAGQHVLGRHGPYRHTETVAKTVAYGRSRHGDDLDVLVLEFCFDDRNPGLLFINGRYRAMRETLTTVDAYLVMGDFMRPPGFTDHRACRTIGHARVAADTFRFIDFYEIQAVRVRFGIWGLHFVKDFFHFNAAHPSPPRKLFKSRAHIGSSVAPRANALIPFPKPRMPLRARACGRGETSDFPSGKPPADWPGIALLWPQLFGQFGTWLSKDQPGPLFQKLRPAPREHPAESVRPDATKPGMPQDFAGTGGKNHLSLPGQKRIPSQAS